MLTLNQTRYPERSIEMEEKSIIETARVYFSLSIMRESYDTIDYCGVVKFTSGWSKVQCYSIQTILELLCTVTHVNCNKKNI